MCVSYHSSTRPSCPSSASFHRTTASDGHTHGCCRTARYPCTRLRKYSKHAITAAPILVSSYTNTTDLKDFKVFSQQLASSASRGQSGNPSQIMLALIHTLLPGHSHRARSEQPDRDTHVNLNCVALLLRVRNFSGGGGTLILKCVFLTAVLFVTVVVTVQVTVTALGCQDASTRPTLEVAGGALCCRGNTQKRTTISQMVM